MEDSFNPTVFVFGPGGVKGYLELGAALKLEKEGWFLNSTHYTGCSIGSGTALMLSCGYTMTDIVDDCMEYDIFTEFDNLDWSNMIDRGILENSTMEELLKSRVENKFGFIPTLKQLYLASGIVFTAVSYNETKKRTEYLNKDTEPDLSCIEAALMSMAMPVIFKSRVYNDCEYIDGAIGDPYPVLIHDNGQKDILGMYINTNSESVSNLPGQYSKIWEKAARVFMGPIKEYRDKIISWSSDRVKHLKLCCDIRDPIGVTVNKDSRQKMVIAGYKVAATFIDKLSHPEKYKLLLSDDEEIPQLEDVIKYEKQHGKTEKEILDLLNGSQDDDIFHELLNIFPEDSDKIKEDINSNSDEIVWVTVTQDMLEKLPSMFNK